MSNFTHFDPTHLWEVVLIPACILLVSLLVGILINNIINRRIRTHLTDTDSLQFVFIHALRGLPVAWCLGIGLYWTINSSDLSPSLTKFLSYILFSIIILALTRVIARTVSGMVDLQTQKGDDKIPKTSLLTNIINLIIYAMGALIILDYCGISIAPIVTALGVGGMAVALGLQDTLANLFSGVHLILSKQLRLDDYIRLSSGEEGRVTDITWRFTTILAGSGNVIVVPNQKIATAILTNYSMPRQDISISIPIGVSYDSDLDAVERITLEVAREVMTRVDHKIDLDPIVRFHTFGDSSIDFNVILYSSEFANQFLLKHEFIKALTKRYREESIDMPYPIRTILQEIPVQKIPPSQP